MQTSFFSAGKLYLLAIFLAAISLTGCGGGGGGDDDVIAVTLSRVEVTPTNPSIAKGTTQQFAATAVFSDNTTQDVTNTATWSSSSTSVASVGNTGLATGNNVGTTVITATFQGVSGTTNLTVTAAVLSRVDVTPTNPQVPKGTTQQFAATAVFSDATTQDATSSATWSSSNTSIAQVSNTAGTKGLASANNLGDSTISALFNGVTGSTTMTVTAAAITALQVTPTNAGVPAGFERQYTATATLSDGTTRDATTDVSWLSTNTGVATISNAAGSKGLATGVAPGQTTIVAQSGSVQGSTILTVTNATLSSIQVTPMNPSVAKGLSQQFTATGTFSNSTTENLTTQVTWSSSNTAAATVSNAPGSKGLAQTVNQGVTTITATKNAVSGSTNLTVTAAALTSIEVTPNPASVAKGLTRQFTATGSFSDNTTSDITTTVTWSSSSPGVATISNAAGSNGLATGVAEGTSTITATLSGVNGTAALTVTAAVLQSINVTPATPSVPRGLQQQFTATGTFSDMSTQNLTTSVTWTSGTPAVATISNAVGSKGLASTLAEGTSTITATMGAVSGQTTLTVTPVALISIGITPTDPSVAKGRSQDFTATGNFSDGTQQDFTQQVTWASSNPAVADISNAAGSKGRAFAANLGTVTISVTDPATMVVGQTSMTVTAAVLTGITVSPVNGTLPANFFRQYTATGQFSDGTSQDVTTQVTWTSLNTAIATASNAPAQQGRVTGVSAGVTSIVAATGSVSGSTSLTVTIATLQSIAVTPATATIPPGGSQQFTATGTFTDAATLVITTQVTWSSSNTNVATISNAQGSQGLATAGVLPGSTTISATRDGQTGTATLTRSPL